MDNGWIKQMDDWYDTRNIGELRSDYSNLRYLYERVISRINRLNDDTKEMKDSRIPMGIVDKFLQDITNIVGS